MTLRLPAMPHSARGPSSARHAPSQLQSTTSTSAPQNASTTSRQVQPLARMLDRRLESVSTFVSSTQSLGAGLRAGFESKPSAEDSQWCDDMPQAVLFPANKPSSRADAAVLDRWVTGSLAAYAQRSTLGFRADDKDLSKAVEELVPLLSIGLHEVVRQVTQHCLQRGVVLEKIWRTYVELFERALDETRAALKRQRERTAKVEQELQKKRQELTDLQLKHPEQIEKLSQTLAGKFAQRQEELGEQVKGVRNENQALEEHLQDQSRSVQSWFPLFATYKESEQLREALGGLPPSAPTQPTPEARIAADYKRILTAMPTEGKRRVGFFVSSLLGLRGAQATSESVESLQERKEHNQWKISQLEERLEAAKKEAQAAGVKDVSTAAVAQEPSTGAREPSKSS